MRLSLGRLLALTGTEAEIHSLPHGRAELGGLVRQFQYTRLVAEPVLGEQLAGQRQIQATDSQYLDDINTAILYSTIRM